MTTPVDGLILAEALDAEGHRHARLAALLHDYALQSLLLARQELVEGDCAAALRALDVGIEQLRETVGGLHPVALEHGGLHAAIAHVANAAAVRHDLELSVDVEPGIGGAHVMLLLALTRELVGNVERHAGARRLRVVLRSRAAQLELEVADDGRGFDGRGRDPRGDGLGLASIEQRVKAAGGELDVVSADGYGTSVTARIPV